MHILELKLLPHQYSIHRLLPKYKLPDLLYRKNSFFLLLQQMMKNH
jgi:hypothetical protein